MPEWNFTIEAAKPVRPAVTPLLGFRVHLVEAEANSTHVHSIVLHSQVRIEPARRKYDGPEQQKLVALFDSPDRWGKTVRNLLWSHVTTVVPSFTGETIFELQVPCSFDFSLAATRFFDALNAGDIPLAFLFSGTVFYEAGDGGMLQVAQIPWEKEAKFRLTVSAWKELMDVYYPNTAWLSLRKDVFDSLQRFSAAHGFSTCERAVEELLMTVAAEIT
jgi:hypothetical protein